MAPAAVPKIFTPLVAQTLFTIEGLPPKIYCIFFAVQPLKRIGYIKSAICHKKKVLPKGEGVEHTSILPLLSVALFEKRTTESKEEAFPYLAILAKNICRLGALANDFNLVNWLSHLVRNFYFCIKGGQRQEMQRQKLAWL